MLTSLTKDALLQPEAEEKEPPVTGIPTVEIAVEVMVGVGVTVGVEVGVAVDVSVGWAVSVAATSVATCEGIDSAGCGAALPQALNRIASDRPIAIEPLRLRRQELNLGKTIFLFIRAS